MRIKARVLDTCLALGAMVFLTTSAMAFPTLGLGQPTNNVAASSEATTQVYYRCGYYGCYHRRAYYRGYYRPYYGYNRGYGYYYRPRLGIGLGGFGVY